jgi:hypothetical protein
MRMQQQSSQETFGVRRELSAWDLLVASPRDKSSGEKFCTGHITQIESIEQLCAEWNASSQSLFK